MTKTTKTDGGEKFNPWATLERRPAPPAVPTTETLEVEEAPAPEPFDPWAPLNRR